MNNTIKDELKIKPIVKEYEPVLVKLQEEEKTSLENLDNDKNTIDKNEKKTIEKTDDGILDYHLPTLKKKYSPGKNSKSV